MVLGRTWSLAVRPLGGSADYISTCRNLPVQGALKTISVREGVVYVLMVPLGMLFCPGRFWRYLESIAGLIVLAGYVHVGWTKPLPFEESLLANTAPPWS